ncbi:hypothetical protein FPRO05_11019 [Fusarium proliferatum]|uniref:AB hydrolase-1 domain-containing protein n=1 Tax=Gibberella intermedia TaxID=948311 RepID=A0A365NB06_GIBIN|nr:hypothetical protein FPRO05_11019 [Fusarium proliferatum]
MATPTVVIVPGSFAPSKHYRVFTESLERHGIDSRVIDTPSVGKRGNLPPATMSDDADEITNVVSKLLGEGKEVILMTHSYGGIPGTQSLSKLSRKAREAGGKQGGVDKIIYLASDRIIPPQFQRAMIEGVKASSGKEVTVHSFDSGHVPTVSQPDNVSKVVKEIIGV